MTGRQLRTTCSALLAPALASTALAACGFTVLDPQRSAMVAAAKAAGLIDHRLPADCTRVYVSDNWGSIDQPLWDQKDPRCSPFSRKLMVVFHQVGGKWNIVAVRRTFGNFGPCAVPRVPAGVSRRLPIC